jgi:hypothetical protein
MLEVLNALRDHYVSKVFSKCNDESLSPYERLRELSIRAEEIFTFEETGDFFVNIGLETINSNPSFAKVIKNFFNDWIGSLSDLYRHVLDEEDATVHAERVVAELEGSVIMMKILGDVNYLKRSTIRVLKEFKKLEKNKISKVYND